MSASRYGAEPSRVTRTVILSIVGAVFLIPLLALLQFSLRIGQPDASGVQTFGTQHYLDIFNPAFESTYDPLFTGLGNSLVICAITVLIVLVLLLPTMILVELKFPRYRRILEFVCIIPITIPAVVLVVGFIPIYSVVAQVFGSTPWTLAFAIGVIVLPYAYRPIAANLAGVDVVTLSEAARSLGASWTDVITRVIVPNLRRGILSSVFITIAVVLGEYTIASFLSQNTFQTALALIQQTDPYVAAIFALFALLVAFALLVLIGRLGSVGRKRRSS
ncbi:MAG: putative spermidine/putrescine transport system permease protein [Actinomycetota bacterium]|jgi:putative spermidine/putrescine transport system permease protein|nr:putative spermidine/putrescine transport system permease protein [Actinomycetota bacterium]